jgi:hypothetical protein
MLKDVTRVGYVKVICWKRKSCKKVRALHSTVNAVKIDIRPTWCDPRATSKIELVYQWDFLPGHEESAVLNPSQPVGPL